MATPQEVRAAYQRLMQAYARQRERAKQNLVIVVSLAAATIGAVMIIKSSGESAKTRSLDGGGSNGRKRAQ